MFDISDIYTKGFVKLSEPDGIHLIDAHNTKLLNVEERSRDNGIKDVPEELSNRLTLFGQYIKTKYIDPEWPEAVYNKFIIWEGVDRDNQGWHTDMFEGYDIFFLYYLTNTFPETGGYIEFKWKDGEERHYPKAGDLFMVNNCRGFWHRAGASTIKRRLASFDYNVGLENVD